MATRRSLTHVDQACRNRAQKIYRPHPGTYHTVNMAPPLSRSSQRPKESVLHWYSSYARSNRSVTRKSEEKPKAPELRLSLLPKRLLRGCGCHTAVPELIPITFIEERRRSRYPYTARKPYSSTGLYRPGRVLRRVRAPIHMDRLPRYERRVPARPVHRQSSTLERRKINGRTHRKTTTVAHSSGCPGRRIGVWSTPAIFSAENVDVTSGVRIGPGAIAFTRICLSPTSWFESPRVNATTAPLVAVL